MLLGSVQETQGSIYTMVQNGEGGQANSGRYYFLGEKDGKEHYPVMIFKYRLKHNLGRDQ
jgi:hypothetical protein